MLTYKILKSQEHYSASFMHEWFSNKRKWSCNLLEVFESLKTSEPKISSVPVGSFVRGRTLNLAASLTQLFVPSVEEQDTFPLTANTPGEAEDHGPCVFTH